MANRWRNSENSGRLFCRVPKSLQMMTAAMKWKDACFLKKNYDQLSILKSRDVTLPTKVHLVKAMVLPVVMYGCESWTVKKAEHWRMAGWHHRLDGRESEWTLGVGDGQGGLTCCSSWGLKESDTTEWLNWTELNWRNECYIDKKRFKAGKWEWKSKGGWEKAVCEMWGELREMGDLKPSEDSTSKRRECLVWSGAAEME